MDWSRILALEETVAVRVEAPQSGQRLDRALVELLPFASRQRVARWIRAGRVALDGRVELKPARRLLWGQRVRVVVDKTPRDLAEPWGDLLALDILHEADDWLVADKPAGLLCHPAGGVIKRTLLTAIATLRSDRCEVGGPWLPHRLDRDTSGLVVVALTAAAQQRFARAFQHNAIRRLYRARVHGAPDATRRAWCIDAPLRVVPGKPTRVIVDSAGRPSRTRLRIRRVLSDTAEVAIEPVTGRQHQIRVHLAHLGHPIVGDRRYGLTNDPAPRLLLDACALLVPGAVAAPGGVGIKVVRRRRRAADSDGT